MHHISSTSRPIEDYAVVGNMISAALISRDGSIDWLCLPRFDSAAAFASLLGTRENGHWSMQPADPFRTSRKYVSDTAVLETRFETDEGVVTVTDFMPFTDDEEKVDLVRIVRGVSGSVRMKTELVLRFNYGQAMPWVRRRDYGLSAVAGPDAVELHTSVPFRGHAMTSVAEFVVREGEAVPFTLSYHPSHKVPHFIRDSSEILDQTVSWWREWSKHCRFKSDNERWCEAVKRSLITLKLLVYRPTGGIIAAPTTSLPETIGGVRNWDYRYCWLRDSALTFYALLNAGYREEAVAWRTWLLRTVAGHPQQLQIMYGMAGERWLPEFEVPWLAGYENSRPVRVGNDAMQQVQHDVYGELMETLHAAREAKLSSSGDAWKVQRVMLDHLQATWRKPDQGIWEVRGPARHFTHSRLMTWVAFDRAIKSVEHFGLEGDVDEWRATREAIREDILARGYDARRNTFVQHYGGDAVDASLLLIPQVGFLPPDDPRFVGTIAQIERELMPDGVVLRYATHLVDDGVGGKEGAFLACSFWLADAYIMSGRGEAARDLFEQLLSYRNDVGLLAEEYDPVAGRLVGNFPQAFSHIGLVNTAFNLARPTVGPAQQRAERRAPTDDE
ncbi:MAG: glycoside hydrolase family 15 protein [Hyphomicrobiaceae bacterium]